MDKFAQVYMLRLIQTFIENNARVIKEEKDLMQGWIKKVNTCLYAIDAII